MQRFEHDMVSIKLDRHAEWLLDTLPQMVSLRLTPRSAMRL